MDGWVRWVPSYLKPATLDNGDVWSMPGSPRLGTSRALSYETLALGKMERETGGRTDGRTERKQAAKWKSRAINKMLQSALKIKQWGKRRWNSTEKKNKLKIQNRKPKTEKCRSTWRREFCELWPQKLYNPIVTIGKRKTRILSRLRVLRIRLSDAGSFYGKNDEVINVPDDFNVRRNQ